MGSQKLSAEEMKWVNELREAGKEAGVFWEKLVLAKKDGGAIIAEPCEGGIKIREFGKDGRSISIITPVKNGRVFSVVTFAPVTGSEITNFLKPSGVAKIAKTHFGELAGHIPWINGYGKAVPRIHGGAPDARTLDAAAEKRPRAADTSLARRRLPRFRP